jgi:hypothetical protein
MFGVVIPILNKFKRKQGKWQADNMTTRTWGILIVALAMAVPSAYARDLQLAKKAGEYGVEIRIDRNPPILGDNNIIVEIKNSAGTPIDDADVLVNYYMPPMPRMAPMNYITKTKLNGKKYNATMNLIMAGPWIIAVKITREGKTTTAKFNIDAQ